MCLREVTQLWLCNAMDCSPPGSSVRGILQARILEWVAISFSRGSSRPRDQTHVSWSAGRRFTIWATREVHIYVYVCVCVCVYVYILNEHKRIHQLINPNNCLVGGHAGVCIYICKNSLRYVLMICAFHSMYLKKATNLLIYNFERWFIVNVENLENIKTTTSRPQSSEVNIL